MRIFDETLMNELHNVDETKGWFDEAEFITWVDEYVDKDGNIVYGHQESERVKVYYLYTDDELKEKNLYEYNEEELKELEYQRKLNEIKTKHFNILNELSSTDYRTLKYLEGWYTEEEYAPIKAYRESLREKIRELEKELEEIEDERSNN